MEFIKNIKNIIIKVLVLVALVSLGACGGGDSSTPTDPNLVFSLFPPAYFGGAYSQNYTLSGTVVGQSATGNFRVNSGTRTTFNKKIVNTLVDTITLSVSGGSITSSGETYYNPPSVPLSGERIVAIHGSYSNQSGVTYTTTSLQSIPLTGRIGDFGDVGSFIGSDGSSLSMTWSLEDGYNGKAKLVLKELSSLGTTETVYTIALDGTRESLKITAKTTSGSMTLNGKKL